MNKICCSIFRKYRDTAPSVSICVSVHTVSPYIDISMNRPSPTCNSDIHDTHYYSVA